MSLAGRSPDVVTIHPFVFLAISNLPDLSGAPEPQLRRLREF
jgi:hypothetical protein